MMSKTMEGGNNVEKLQVIPLMEQRDLEIIKTHEAKDAMLARLYEEHLTFESQLEKFNHKPYLTPVEEKERKDLQKMKLKGRDEIEKILRHYRDVLSPR